MYLKRQYKIVPLYSKSRTLDYITYKPTALSTVLYRSNPMDDNIFNYSIVKNYN